MPTTPEQRAARKAARPWTPRFAREAHDREQDAYSTGWRDGLEARQERQEMDRTAAKSPAECAASTHSPTGDRTGTLHPWTADASPAAAASSDSTPADRYRRRLADALLSSLERPHPPKGYGGRRRGR